MKIEAKRHLDIIKENAVDVISETELLASLEDSLKSKKPLKLKIGFDPTAKDIHLGHTVLLRKLRKLQDLGHTVTLIIGDFTAKIGDPSGKTLLRPVLGDEEIKENAATYTEQAFKILDEKKTEVKFNSSWYKSMDISKFLSLLSSYTVARILERDDFSLRMKENRPLTILELVYPIIQGYDSVVVDADIEFGGTDQKFNLIVGRHLKEVFGKLPQRIVTMPLLVGLDGKNKMSKSLGNYIGVTDEPKDMFGKIMSISDLVMWEYFRLLTDCDIAAARKIHPKEAKLLLAETIVSFYYSKVIGKSAKEEFEKIFSQKEIPEDMPLSKVKGTPADLIEVLFTAKIVTSKNEARRLLAQGSIAIMGGASGNGTVKDAALEIPSSGVVIKIGKKKFLRVIIDN
ncbi:MAG: tyrosine--tRNA ligase [Candidatus Omnitrophota bacterium]|jgi:tyrosyl-tRNA synthetase